MAFERLLEAHAQGAAVTDLLCRYPARLLLYERHDRLPTGWQPPQCTDPGSSHSAVKATRGAIPVTSVSIVFASGYFRSPGSYFGHTLLKFSYGNDRRRPAGLDSSLNYGADSGKDRGLRYALLGVLGGYDGSYARNDYFLHSHRYANAEIRDTWEYEVDLAPEELRFVIALSEELTRARFRYFFFGDNCAHRVVRPIELATGRQLSTSHGFWLLPVQAVRKLGNPKPTSLVRQERYRPSLRSRLVSDYGALSRAQRSSFNDFLKRGGQSSDPNKLSLPVLRLLLRYLDLQAAEWRSESETTPRKQARHKALQAQRSLLLRELMRRPPDTVISAPQPREKSPTVARAPSRVRVGTGTRAGRVVQRAGYRVANHDLLDEPEAGQQTSRFLMGDVVLEHDNGSVEVRNASLIDVFSLDGGAIPRRVSGGRAWRFAVDYAARHDVCSECANVGIEGAFGGSLQPSPNILYYALAGGRLHSRADDWAGYLTGTAELGAVLSLGRDWRARLGVEGFVAAEDRLVDSHWSVALARRFGRRFDARVTVSGASGQHYLQLSAGYAFD